jgi:soluble cytochrome b562
MKNSFISSGFGKLLLCAALVLSVTMVPAFATKALVMPANGNSQQTFLGSVADTTTAIGDHQATSGAGKAAEEAEKAFKKALEAGLASDKYAKQFEKLGKYAGVIDKVLKVIKFGDLSVHCISALRSGDKAAFSKAFNEMMKEAIKTVAGMGGAAGGAALGGTIGGVAGGGLASIVTGGIGAFLGGWLGDYLAAEGAGAAYDAFLSDWVKNDLSNSIFDQLGATTGPGGPGSGGPGGLPPPAGGTGSPAGGKAWRGMDRY